MRFPHMEDMMKMSVNTLNILEISDSLESLCDVLGWTKAEYLTPIYLYFLKYRNIQNY